ncbi:hypothetical protein D8I24_5043 [Cupriavidus necator H850]|nr:hypothetical protein D8I24_5043 [Cupriavidus necator H850]
MLFFYGVVVTDFPWLNEKTGIRTPLRCAHVKTQP